MGAVAGLIVVLGLMNWGKGSFHATLALLTLFFVMFNVLEALQPSLVSRVALAALQGLGAGFYNTRRPRACFAAGGGRHTGGPRGAGVRIPGGGRIVGRLAGGYVGR